MTELGDTSSTSEHSFKETLGKAVSWTVREAQVAYKGVEAASPLSKENTDIALAVAGATVVAFAAKEGLSRVVSSATDSAIVSAGLDSKAISAGPISIHPLSHANLESAIAAGKDGFSYGWPFLNPAKGFRASLDPELAAAVPTDLQTEMHFRYFVAVDDKGHVLGTTGLYEKGADQHNVAWLGWMSVRKEARGQGIGTALLKFSIDEARAQGKDYLNLYTSTAQGEAAAQRLYEQHGFRVVSSSPHPIPRVIQRLYGEREPLQLLNRQLNLTDHLTGEASGHSESPLNNR